MSSSVLSEYQHRGRTLPHTQSPMGAIIITMFVNVGGHLLD
nr:MAG TPA: hypothetical protein [Caudoviricetes sp.]